MKKASLRSLLLAVLFVTVLAGVAHAAQFSDWAGVWFKATATESGFQATQLPTEGKVKSYHASIAGNVFVKVNSCDISTTACSLNVCVLTNAATQTWSLHPNITVTTYAGSALDFLTVLDFTYTLSAGHEVQYSVPLRIKGSVDKKAPDVIKSASVNSSGGLFIETVTTTSPATVATGSLSLNGAFIPSNKVASKVPSACQ